MAGNLKFEKIKVTRVLLMLACLLGMAMPIAPACAAEPVKIGVLTYRPKPQTLAQWQPLAAALKQAVPGRDFVVEALDFTEMETAVAARQLDFALTNSAHYILLAKRGGMSAPLATLAADAQGKAVAVSGGVIFSRAEQEKINSLADLRGKTIAVTSTGSVGGYQAQAYELKHAGIRLPQDAKMQFTGMPDDNVVAAVLAGRADAGFVRTGVLEDLAREGKLDMAQVKIINRQDLPGFPAQASTRLYPQWSFAASSHIDENLARHVAAALFRLEENPAAAKAMNIHGFVIPADYTPVADMLRELRLPPFDAAPEFSFYDVWRQYRWQVIFFLIAAGLILLLGLRLLISNRKLKTTHLTVLQQKQQLEESEQRYRLLFSNNPLPMFILAEDSLAFLEVNERAIKHYGFTREEFSRMTLYDIRVAEGDLEFKRAIASSPGGKVLIEARQKKKDGAVIDAVINAMPIKYGTTPAWIMLMQDITGRRAIQRKMAEQLAFIKAVINAEVNALSVCHGIDEPPYTRFTVWNPSMEALTGYRMEEINHLGWYQTVYTDPELQEQARQRMERMRQGDHLHGEEWTITRKDGGRRVVQVYTVTVTEDKRGAHTLAVMQDITERKQIEAALHESEKLYRSLFENTLNGLAYCQMIFEQDQPQDFIYLSVNAAFETLTGLKNVAGKRVSEVIPGIRQSDAGLFEIYGRVSLSGKPEQIEIYVKALQQWFWMSVYSPEKGYFLTAFDLITERKEYEEELKRSNAELEQFGYAISHDMRQPLRMISSYLQLIEISLSDQLDSEKRDYFNFAIDGAKRIDQMLVALLEYSRVGRMGELPGWIESRAVFDEALLFLQPAINEAQARLDISGDWPSIFVNHDEILRLMQNLIGNAAKFRVAGRTPEITITSKLGKNEWHLCVADNGIGLIPDQIKRLFQMFQRLQLRAAYEGNGVGLALCRKIVEHHKGRIWAESAGEGQGSKFHVVLPVPPQST